MDSDVFKNPLQSQINDFTTKRDGKSSDTQRSSINIFDNNEDDFRRKDYKYAERQRIE